MKLQQPFENIPNKQHLSQFLNQRLKKLADPEVNSQC